MTSISKELIAEKLSNKLGLSRAILVDITNDLFNVMSDSIIAHKTLKITNFGSFKVNYKSSRPGYNLSNMEKVDVAARHRVSFSASKFLRELINDK